MQGLGRILLLLLPPVLVHLFLGQLEFQLLLMQALDEPPLFVVKVAQFFVELVVELFGLDIRGVKAPGLALRAEQGLWRHKGLCCQRLGPEGRQRLLDRRGW